MCKKNLMSSEENKITQSNLIQLNEKNYWPNNLKS